MASFSLDGSAGWTTNGIDWKSFTHNGRNWDFGSVDWAAPAPQTILAAKHETNPPVNSPDLCAVSMTCHDHTNERLNACLCIEV